MVSFTTYSPDGKITADDFRALGRFEARRRD
jgi:hypothetical protein